MLDEINKYSRDFKSLLDMVECTDGHGVTIDFANSMAGACTVVRNVASSGGKVLFIGNGGSAAISSHMAIDFWKNGGIRAMAFNDASLLTCIGNDFGYAHVFEKPIEMFADKGDVLFAISSSGRSENILNGVRAAVSRGVRVITLSGFQSDNPLRAMGEVNFYVPALHYGHVEVIHQYICHCVLDIIMAVKENG